MRETKHNLNHSQQHDCNNGDALNICPACGAARQGNQAASSSINNQPTTPAGESSEGCSAFSFDASAGYVESQPDTQHPFPDTCPPIPVTVSAPEALLTATDQADLQPPLIHKGYPHEMALRNLTNEEIECLTQPSTHEESPMKAGKPFYQSKTIIGLIVTGIALFLGVFFNKQIDASSQATLVQAGLLIVQAAGLIFAAFGRAMAHEPITMGENSTKSLLAPVCLSAALLGAGAMFTGCASVSPSEAALINQTALSARSYSDKVQVIESPTESEWKAIQVRFENNASMWEEFAGWANEKSASPFDSKPASSEVAPPPAPASSQDIMSNGKPRAWQSWWQTLTLDQPASRFHYDKLTPLCLVAVAAPDEDNDHPHRLE